MFNAFYFITTIASFVILYSISFLNIFFLFFDKLQYHVISRGNTRSRIYKNDGDKIKFLEYLLKAHKKYKIVIHSYCLMDNRYDIMNCISFLLLPLFPEISIYHDLLYWLLPQHFFCCSHDKRLLGILFLVVLPYSKYTQSELSCQESRPDPGSVTIVLSTGWISFS